jgi:hypothetical protein
MLPEHIVACGLRILGGGRPKDQHHIIETSPDAACKAFNFFLIAMNSLPGLEIKMRKSREDWDSIYKSFKCKSTSEIMAGCVGCLDGFFQRSMRPSKIEVANVISYYSGHYEPYGLNCQACVKCDLEFMYFGVVPPGSTNDNIWYSQSFDLKKIFESLSTGVFILSDAAYTLSEPMLIPLTGVDRSDPAHDAFNYYLSQLCIYVEMAFGRLVGKFRIFSGTVGGSMDRVSSTSILTACTRLHNYIISEDRPFNNDNNFASTGEEMEALGITADNEAPLGMSFLPVILDDDFESFPGILQTREATVEHINEHDIHRPLHNIALQRREQLDMVISTDGSAIDRKYVSPM